MSGIDIGPVDPCRLPFGTQTGEKTEDGINQQRRIIPTHPVQEPPAIPHPQHLIPAPPPLGQHDLLSDGPARHGGNDRVHFGKPLPGSPGIEGAQVGQVSHPRSEAHVQAVHKRADARMINLRKGRVAVQARKTPQNGSQGLQAPG